MNGEQIEGNGPGLSFAKMSTFIREGNLGYVLLVFLASQLKAGLVPQNYMELTISSPLLQYAEIINPG